MNSNFVLVSFLTMFVAVILLVLIVIVKNSRLPRLVVNATVLEKQTRKVRRTHPRGGNAVGVHVTYSTWYYVTFEVEGGDHIELQVKKQEYDKRNKGDYGKLTFQGTRYLGFEKTKGKIEDQKGSS
nr:DUF2500 domain-containing protein [uncultured Solibaculum sp.]